MARGVLMFTLPSENNEWQIAVNAMDWALAVWDIQSELHKWLKYGHKFETADEAIEGVQKELFDILSERDITTDSIA